MKEKTLNITAYSTKSQIKYSQFMQLNDLVDNEEIDELFLQNRILNIFFNLQPKDIRLIKQKDIDSLLANINYVINQPISEFSRLIEMDGVTYGFLPNFADITAGELIDIDDCQERNDIISLTSILYRPIIGKVNKLGEYQIEEYKGYTDNFKNVSLDVVEGYLSFFEQSFQILNHSTTPFIK